MKRVVTSLFIVMVCVATSTFQHASAAPHVGVTKMTAKASGSQVALSGWATFSGAVIGSATDSAKDASLAQGAPGGSQPAAAAAGAELIGADLVYRPELADLFIRIRVTSIPTQGPIVGLPNVLYGLRTVVSGVPVEVRMQSTGLTSQFGLFDCSSETGCTQVSTTISGGYGTTGEEIVAAVPLAAFAKITSVKNPHLREGEKIGTPVAFVAQAPFNVGAVSDAATMDDIVLAKKTATIAIPVKSVRVTIGSTARMAALKNGYFTVSFPTSAFGGKRTTTAVTRTCLGKSCVVQKFTVSR
jgi:hypothetical protein